MKILLYIGMAVLSFTAILHTMEREAEELNVLGSGEPDEALRHRAEAIFQLYRSRGLLTLAAPPDIRLMSEDYLNELARESIATWSNAVNNGRNRIWIGPQYRELSLQALDSRISHEIAHIALNQPQNHWLNPHVWTRYLWDASFWVSLVSMPFTLLALPLAGLTGAELFETMRKKFGQQRAQIPQPSAEELMIFNRHLRHVRVWTFLGSIIAGSHFLYHRLTKDIQEFLPTPLGYNFRSAQRLEEVMCDLIAAWILPRGGQSGVELYTQSLQHNGDSQGGGTHPRTTTRIQYHRLIAFLQQYTRTNQDDLNDQEKR